MSPPSHTELFATYTIVIIIFLITGFTADLNEFPQAARRVIQEQFPSSTVTALQWYDTVDTSTICTYT